MTAGRRIGPQMRRAADFVADNPGCTKLLVAEAIGPHGSRQFGYRAVDRAMGAGLIHDEGDGRYRYALYPGPKTPATTPPGKDHHA